MPNSLIAFLTDSVRYFPKIPNRAEPNNTKPKLRYLVNSVRSSTGQHRLGHS